MTRPYSRCTDRGVGVITQAQLDELWEKNGLKNRIGRFRYWLRQRGLYEHVTEEKLQGHFYEVLQAYFVKGLKETTDERTSGSPGNAAG